MARKERKLDDIMEQFQTKPEEEVREITEEIPTSGNIFAESLKESWEKKKSKPTKEDTHKRVTFLLDRDLNDRLDALADAEGRGFKTEFLNNAVRAMLQSYNA